MDGVPGLTFFFSIFTEQVDVAVEDFDKHSDNDPLGNTKFTILGEGSGTHSGKLQDIEQVNPSLFLSLSPQPRSHLNIFG